MLGNAFVNKVAVVTAGTSGIGKETGRLLGASGAEVVVINGRNAETGIRVCDELSALFPATRYEFIAADLNNPALIEGMFESIAKKFGRVDVLVHCGGAQVKPGFFTTLDPALYGKQIDGHFVAFMNCCRGVIPLMQSGGSIVVVASDAGKVATPTESIIGAMKAAVIMFARTLALELSRQNIRVNVITPSIVADTISYDRVMSTEIGRRIFQKAEHKAKLGVPTPVDIAPMAVFLASPFASKITGQAISVNGGISAA